MENFLFLICHGISLVKLDGFVKNRKTPSPSMGEGWGEGE